MRLTERNRYRLTGAIVLAAAAAVALPMLFDGEGVAPMQLDPLPPAQFAVTPDESPPPSVAPALEARKRRLPAAVHLAPVGAGLGHVRRRLEPRLGQPHVRVAAEPVVAPLAVQGEVLHPLLAPARHDLEQEPVAVAVAVGGAPAAVADALDEGGGEDVRLHRFASSSRCRS